MGKLFYQNQKTKNNNMYKMKNLKTPTAPNRLFSFFSTLVKLIDNGSLQQNRDYKLQQSANVPLLHINIESVHPHYAQKASYSQLLTKQSLLAYLRCNDAWISFAKPLWDDSQQPSLSVVLNYDILKEKLSANNFLLNL